MRGRMIVALCLALSGPMGADAQPAARVFSSGGLGVTIEGATPNNGGGSGAGGVSVRMTITNQTSRRAYLFAVGAQNAVLSNGASLYLRNVAGVTYCSQDAGYDESRNITKCRSDPQKLENIDYYSYLDPGDSVTVSYIYSSIDMLQALPPDTSISLSVDCIVRSGPTDDQRLGAEASGEGIAAPHLVEVHVPPVVIAGGR